MWRKNNVDIKYEDTKNTNQAGIYASTILHNQINMLNSGVYQDVKLVLNGGCQYIPELVCKRNDLSLFKKLEDELKSKNMINWSKHHKYENPDDLETFNFIVKKLCDHFIMIHMHIQTKKKKI
jgi:hypothetical protein